MNNILSVTEGSSVYFLIILLTDHLSFKEQNQLHKHVSKVVLWLSALDEYDIVLSMSSNYSPQSTNKLLILI